MKNDLVSIIITSFNAENFIFRTLNSVLKQSYKNWELIIIDDCSNDNTRKIIANFIKNINNINNVKLILNKTNLGCNYSRNLAINESSGRFIALLDHDDYWLSDKLKIQVSFHFENKCGASCTYYRRFNARNDLGKLIKAPNFNTKHDILFQNNIGYSSVMIDKKFSKNFQMIDSPLSDFPTWINLLNNEIIFRTINEDLMRYYYHKSTGSYNKIKMVIQRWQVLRNYTNVSMLRALFLIIVYIFRSVLKYRNL